MVHIYNFGSLAYILLLYTYSPSENSICSGEPHLLLLSSCGLDKADPSSVLPEGAGVRRMEAWDPGPSVRAYFLVMTSSGAGMELRLRQWKPSLELPLTSLERCTLRLFLPGVPARSGGNLFCHQLEESHWEWCQPKGKQRRKMESQISEHLGPVNK